MENIFRKQRYVQYYKINLVIQNYDSYWYRNLIVAPLGDGISMWNVKNTVD